MRGGRAGEEEAAAADTELKTKTPHVNVGNKRQLQLPSANCSVSLSFCGIWEKQMDQHASKKGKTTGNYYNCSC